MKFSSPFAVYMEEPKDNRIYWQKSALNRTRIQWPILVFIAYMWIGSGLSNFTWLQSFQLIGYAKLNEFITKGNN